MKIDKINIEIHTDKDTLSYYEKMLLDQKFKFSKDKNSILIQGKIELDKSKDILRIILQPNNF